MLLLDEATVDLSSIQLTEVANGTAKLYRNAAELFDDLDTEDIIREMSMTRGFLKGYDSMFVRDDEDR